MDELNNQYDKVKSADQAIKQGQRRLGAGADAGEGPQRVTWNYDPAKYRVSKEEAAALTGSVDRFIKEFSAKEKPHTSAIEQAQEALETSEQTPPKMTQDTAAAFDALLAQAKAETARASQQARQPAAPLDAQDAPAARHPAAPIAPVADEAAAAQTAAGSVKEGELSGLMDEYMRVMTDEDENERGGRFRRRRKDRRHGRDAGLSSAQTAPVSPPPVVPFGVPEFEAPVDYLAPEDEFVVPEEVVAPVEDAFDLPEEVVAPVEDAFDIPEEVVAPAEDDLDLPEEVVAPVEDDFDLPEEVVAPVEDAFDLPAEVVAPAEDAFDLPEEVVAPVEDAFEVPEEVVAPTEDVFDLPEEVVAPVEDAFEVPEEVVAPVEDAFDLPEEVIAPAEDEFDLPEEVVAPAEDAFEVPEEAAIPEKDAYDVPEEAAIPEADACEMPEEPAQAEEDAAPAPQPEEPFLQEFEIPEEFLMPVAFEFPQAEEASQEEVIIPTEEDACDAPEEAALSEDAFDEDGDTVRPEDDLADGPDDFTAPPEDDEAVVDPTRLFPGAQTEEAPEEAAPAAPQMVDLSDLPEDDAVYAQAPTYPMSFEDVTSYSGTADPEDRFVPIADLSEPEAPAPAAEPAPELDEAPQEEPAAPQKQKKEHRFLRGLGKFFCAILLIVSLLATATVVLVGHVLGINTGEPTVGSYYLFTANHSYEGTGVDEGDLVLCQKTTAIPNDTGVVYMLEGESASFSFGVKLSDRVDSARNVLIYDVSGVQVTEKNLLGTVMQTVGQVGSYIRYIIDHFNLLIAGCAALDVLWILFLILLSRRRKDDAQELPEEAASAEQTDLFNDIV